MNPVFIIGTERSGTNLLRLILNSHDDLTVPHPPHIMKNFKKLETTYGDLDNEVNFNRLITDVLTMVKLHPYPWNLTLKKKEIKDSIASNDLLSIFFACYDYFLANTDKLRWVCKSTFMIHHVHQILKKRPSSQFIFMVRDGRDVLQSAKRSIFNHFHAYHVANLWRDEQQRGIYYLNKLEKKQIHLLKYEDLLTKSEETTEKICDFLNISYDKKMLKYFKTKEAKISSSISKSWENTSSDILANNFNLYKKRLTYNEIKLFESITFKELDFFGYRPNTPIEELESINACGIKNRWSYYLQNRATKINVEIKHLKQDKNRLLRLKKYLFLQKIKYLNKLC